MSTKATIKYGDSFHLYNDCFDDDAIYLELNGKFEIEFSVSEEGNQYLTVRILNKIAADIGIDLGDNNNLVGKIKNEIKEFF